MEAAAEFSTQFKKFIDYDSFKISISTLRFEILFLILRAFDLSE